MVRSGGIEEPLAHMAAGDADEMEAETELGRLVGTADEAVNPLHVGIRDDAAGDAVWCEKLPYCFPSTQRASSKASGLTVFECEEISELVMGDEWTKHGSELREVCGVLW